MIAWFIFKIKINIVINGWKCLVWSNMTMLVITLSIKGQPRCGVLEKGWQRETPGVERARLHCLGRVCGEETLSYAEDLMLNILPLSIPKHLFSQEAVAFSSPFFTSRMHWSQFWKLTVLHLFLILWVGRKDCSSFLMICLHSELNRL